MSLGGRVSERLFLDDISTGASGDIQQATNVARDMVMRYGMSDRLGPILYDTSDHSIFIGRDFGTTKSYSEETAAAIDEEVKRIFDQATADCEKILTEHKKELRDIAEYLLANETMEGDEFDYYFEHGTFMPPELKEVKNDSTIERPARHISMDFGTPAGRRNRNFPARRIQISSSLNRRRSRQRRALRTADRRRRQRRLRTNPRRTRMRNPIRRIRSCRSRKALFGKNRDPLCQSRQGGPLTLARASRRRSLPGDEKNRRAAGDLRRNSKFIAILCILY